MTIPLQTRRQTRGPNACGFAGKAFIELGEAAAGPLKSLLKDDRAAPLWGSEETAEFEKYKYRVKDYAWALLLGAEKKKVEIPTDPAARDRLIAER